MLATTILVATTGIAAAEVTLSGDARMGVVNTHAFGAAADDTSFTSRARVSFGLSGESDAGLSFGASFRADNAAAAAGGTAGSVFATFGPVTVSMGDVDGAANAAVGHVDGVGLTGLGDHNEFIYVATGGLGGQIATEVGLAGLTLTGDPSVLVTYSAGGVSLYASATQPSYTFDADELEGTAYSVGAKYTIGAYTASLGCESLELVDLVLGGSADIDHIVLGGDAVFGQMTVKARYGNGDIAFDGANVADIEQIGLSAIYAMDAVSLTAFVSQKSVEDAAGSNLFSADAMGIGASYGLGGGASVVGGISKLETQVGNLAAQDDTAFDLGLSFAF